MRLILFVASLLASLPLLSEPFLSNRSLKDLIDRYPVIIPALIIGASYVIPALTKKGIGKKRAGDLGRLLWHPFSYGFEQSTLRTICSISAAMIALRKPLIDRPLQKNPWLTLLLYGGTTAYSLGGLAIVARIAPEWLVDKLKDYNDE